MILVTGGTGFIGQVLIRQLISNGYEVRLLLRPSKTTPELPKGMPLDVVLASVTDVRGMRAAMHDVTTVIHLVTGENKGSKTDLFEVDIESTRVVSQAAMETGVDRIIYLSHLGADRASAYPVLKMKGIAENYIKTSGVDYTILRSALVFGQMDHLTNGIKRLLKMSPLFFFLPGDGLTMIQPLWVEDLVGCITGALESERSKNRVYEIGGIDYFTIQEIVQIIQDRIKNRNKIIHLHPAYMRILTVILEHALPSFPITTFWLDYLSATRTCAIDSIPREFGILPSRFTEKIGYITP